MAGPSNEAVIPARNDLDDEEEFGFRFGQLNMNTEDERFVPPYGFSPGPSYAARPPPSAYPSYPNQHQPNYRQQPQHHIQQSPVYPNATPLQSPYLQHQQHPLQRLASQSPFIPYQQWSSPPMSPAMSPMQFGRQGQSTFDEMGMSRGPSWNQLQHQHQHQHHSQHHNQHQTMHMPDHLQSTPGMPQSAWTSPSAPSYQFFTPQQQYSHQFDSPQGMNPGGSMQRHRANRMSWSGGPPKAEGQRERKAYHPQAPAKRSDWVMWVGNVPQNTSHEELWRYFNSTIPPGDEPWKGPSSIFLISRSSCAFVNLSSQEDLDRAVGFFNGRPLRSWDQRCPRMVCRVRRKDDDLRSGVGAQRGTGMHREWVKVANGAGPLSPAAMEPAPEGEGRRRESITDITDQKHKSTNSYASTNSSFLVRHFPRRVFILKSMTIAELEESVQTGTWRTQRHNEPILDQAYRTAPEVFLIFGANKAGGFFGYAKMVEPIDKERAAARAAKLAAVPNGSNTSINNTQASDTGSMSSTRQEVISSPSRPNVLSPTSSSSTIPMASPSQLTPSIEEEKNFESRSVMNPVTSRHSDGEFSNASAPADLRPTTLDPELLRKSNMAGPIAAFRAAEGIHPRPVKASSDKPQVMDDQGVLRKDTLADPEPSEKVDNAQHVEEEEDVRMDPESRGHSFRIEWIRVGGLPFGRTRQLRNPWNSDREVKVSRDGTEVEPNIGGLLMAEWDREM